MSANSTARLRSRLRRELAESNLVTGAFKGFRSSLSRDAWCGRDSRRSAMEASFPLKRPSSKADPIDRLHYPFNRDLGRIIGNPRLPLSQAHVHLLDPREPCQGPLDHGGLAPSRHSVYF